MSNGKLAHLRPVTGDVGEMSDPALLSACATGDRAACTALFDRHADAVFQFLARMLGPDCPDIDDLVQTAFLAALRDAHRYRGSARVSTWLIGIAANAARSYLRGEKRRRRMHEAVVSEPARLPDRPVDAMLVEQIASCVRELPVPLRTVIVLCDIEGMTGDETARTLGIPVGTVWKRLHRARTELRRILQVGREVRR